MGDNHTTSVGEVDSTIKPHSTSEKRFQGKDSQAMEKDRKNQNQQLKVAWHNRFKKTVDVGILCEDKPWDHVSKSQLHFATSVFGLKVVDFISKHVLFFIE